MSSLTWDELAFLIETQQSTRRKAHNNLASNPAKIHCKFVTCNQRAVLLYVHGPVSDWSDTYALLSSSFKFSVKTTWFSGHYKSIAQWQIPLGTGLFDANVYDAIG